MDYSKDVFALQIQFAEKVAHLSQQPLHATLLSHTAFYLLFDIDREFAAENPVWQLYLEGAKQSIDLADYTHRFYQRRQKEVTPEQNDPHWGCFSYTYHNGDRRIIRLHFANRDESAIGPLSSQRKSARLQELSAMFRDIQQTTPEAEMVRGESWLYNRESYTRLFPQKYGQSVQVVHSDFQYRAVWGQFIRWDGQLHPQVTSSFLQNLALQQDASDLAHCLPNQVLRTECSIHDFYSYYGISDQPSIANLNESSKG